jgi:hypothetical protein
MHVEGLPYASNDLSKARAIFAAWKTRRPRGHYTALKVFRAALYEKAGMNFAEMPDPALVADQLSLTKLARVRNCGPTTVASLRRCFTLARDEFEFDRLPLVETTEAGAFHR